jgi:protein TonB
MPFARFLSSASLAMLVTSGLLYLMQLLVDIGPDVITDDQTPALVDWIGKPPTEHVIVDPPKPDRLPDPAPLPPKHIAPETGTTPTSSITTSSPPAPPGPPEFGRPGMSDGPLINIIKVAPIYPVRAITNGIGGFVTVSFDVMANGTVANVVVIESSNRLFEEAAVDAAYRFRYKPRIVDGVALETHGLQNRFIFRIDD